MSKARNLLASSTYRRQNRRQKGFTLIELLVVIAIIGILALIILLALMNARNKGQDAKIKSDMEQIRTQAEIIFDNTSGSYATVLVGQAQIAPLVTDANLASGGAVVINSTATAYAASSALKTGGFFCVDSTGQAKLNAAALGAATVCPAS